MIYTHLLNWGPAAVQSPADHLMSQYRGSIGPTGNSSLIRRTQEIRKDDKSDCFNRTKQRRTADEVRLRLSGLAVPTHLYRPVQL
jgi:hypothetical protein